MAYEYNQNADVLIFLHQAHTLKTFQHKKHIIMSHSEN